MSTGCLFTDCPDKGTVRYPFCCGVGVGGAQCYLCSQAKERSEFGEHPIILGCAESHRSVHAHYQRPSTSAALFRLHRVVSLERLCYDAYGLPQSEAQTYDALPFLIDFSTVWYKIHIGQTLPPPFLLNFKELKHGGRGGVCRRMGHRAMGLLAVSGVFHVQAVTSTARLLKETAAIVKHARG